jgi:DNA-binding CsgD family transcriptional regulator
LQVERNDNDKEKDRIDWRRSEVQELSSQGYSQRDIAQMLQVSNGTVNRDLSILTEQAKVNINDTLMKGFQRNTVVDDAIRFVSSKSRENQASSSSSSTEDTKESNEAEYNKDGNHLEEEQEEETGERTTNEVF